MSTSGVGYADISELAKDYTTAGQSAKAAASSIIRTAIGDIEALAVQYAPARSGQLRGSIHSFMDDPLTGIVEATAPYAAFVELGTGTRGEFPSQMITIRPRNAAALRWVGPDGKVHFAKVVHSPGMKSRPFLRPALSQVIGELSGNLAGAVALSLVKGPHS